MKHSECLSYNRLMTSEYFMDKLEEWELLEFFDVLEYAEYIWWDAARFLFSSQLDTKKVKKLSDIVKFPWDNDQTKEKSNIEITNEEIARMKKLQEEYLKKLHPDNGSTEENRDNSN